MEKYGMPQIGIIGGVAVAIVYPKPSLDSVQAVHQDRAGDLVCAWYNENERWLGPIPLTSDLSRHVERILGRKQEAILAAGKHQVIGAESLPKSLLSILESQIE